MANRQHHYSKQLCTSKNDLPKVVIIEGGFAGISLIKNLSKHPVQIILLDKHNYHQFQPLLLLFNKELH